MPTATPQLAPITLFGWQPRTLLLLFFLTGAFSASAQFQNNCLNFDGIGDEVDCGPMGQLNSTNQLTLEAWVKLDSWNNFKPIVGKYDGNTAQIRMLLGGVQGRIIGLIGNGANSQGWTQSTTALPLNTWTHIAVVYDGTQTGNGNRLRIYVNGVNQALIFQGAIPATTATISNNFHICEAASTTSSNIDGQVDEVRVWTTALSAATIDNWNNIPITSAHPDYSDLVAYYMMDDPLTPLSLADSAGTANGGIFDAVYNPNNNLNFCYPPTIDGVVDNASCSGVSDGEVAVSVSGLFSPYTYAWPTGVSGSGATVNGLGAGTYTVTITDSWGCDYDSGFVVTAPPAITATGAVTDLDCFGDTQGVINVTASGGVGTLAYNWSNAQTTAQISGLAAGTYSLTVTDSLGCTRLDSFQVTQPDSLSIVENILDVDCFGNASGSAAANVAGGVAPYAYAWSGGQTTVSIFGVPAGNYSVTVTDANGCLAQKSLVIDQPDSISLSFAVQDVTCDGDDDGGVTLTVSGGVNPFTAQWTTNSGSLSGLSVSNLEEQTVNVTVTDSNNCVKSGSATIGYIHDLPVVSLGPDVFSPTMPVTLTPGPQYSAYNWSEGSTTPSIDVSFEGGYWVLVTDSNGCMNSDTIYVYFNTGISTTSGLGAVSVFPNPANAVVNLKVEQASQSPVTVSMYSASGQLTHRRRVTDSQIQHFTMKEAGLYLIVVESELGRYWEKVIVE